MMPSAVVSPMPPGQVWPAGSAAMLANTLVLPAGETCTMVVPVPCTLALSLKLLTRMSPAVSRPAEAGTTATPYGFTSPLAGTVEATWVRPCSSPRNAAGVAGRAELEVDVVDEQAAAARPRLIMAVRILAWWPGFTVLPLSKVSAPSASADIPVLGQTPVPAPWSRPNKRAGPRHGSPPAVRQLRFASDNFRPNGPWFCS